MKHKLFRLFFVLTLVVGLAIVSTPQSARAAGPWYVSTTGNDANDCMSPAAPCATINGALNNPGFLYGDTIRVAIGTYTGTGSEALLINKSVILSGGWDASFAIQSGTSTIDGQAARRVITIDSWATVTIERFVIQNGLTIGAPGIYNSGILTINESTVSSNTTMPSGTSIGGAGGIANVQGGVLTLNASTVSGNHADADGGGILNSGTMTINNSTVSGNTAGSGWTGGGILNIGDGNLAINNTTIYGNISGNGGGIYNSGSMVALSNSIIAGNTSNGSDYGPDCQGTINSSGHNLLGDNSGCTFLSTIGDLVGTNANPINPQLTPLQDNGGPTFTHALLSGSPAIDAGNPSGCTDQNGNLLTTDQRGVARFGTCDIGAYEVPTAGLLIVGGNNQSATTTFAFPQPLQVKVFDNQGSPASGVTVTFTAPASGSSGTFTDTGTNTTLVDTNANGVATTSIFTANDQAGAYTVSASAAGLGSANFNLQQVTRPANDNFANATVIGALPFSNTVNNTGATIEPNESQYCYYSPNTVWYSFTPSANALVRADMAGSSFNDTIFNVYQAVGPGFNGLSFMQCAYYGNSATFSVQAGVTYYIQAGSINNSEGNLHLNLQEIPRPANADFANAIAVTSLPFGATPDITNGGVEPNEPQSCYYMSDTVWYSFTPTVKTLVRANTQGSVISNNLNVYHAVSPGISGLNFLPSGCTVYYGTVTFIAEAGQTYYFQVGGIYGQTGTVQVNLEQIPLPANDDFVSAASIGSLPSTINFDATWATFQSGEPSPTCAYYSPPYKTVWYSFTATQTGSVSASVPSYNFSPFIAAYSGTGFNNLTQLGCNQYSNKITFHVVSGQTYYFQVGGLYGGGGTGQFLIETTPPPQASFYNYPSDPSKYDTVQFYDGSNDPGNVGFQTYTWNFGDGSTATGYSPTHKYAADGSYQVTHTVTTVDGRTATITQTLLVRTHDVAITKIATPASANVGQTKTITVTLRNTAYPETVQIDLYKSTANGFVWIATVTKSVPALSGNRTTAVNFSYTFTSDDAKLGKVTFKAVATLVDARDAYPADNEAISSITKVAK